MNTLMALFKRNTPAPVDPAENLEALAALNPSAPQADEPDGVTPTGMSPAEPDESETLASPTRSATPEPEADDPLRDPRVAAEMERVRREAAEREAAFLRQATQPPEPKVDPVAQAISLLRVDARTWNEMVADPERGAAIATEALQRILVLGNHLARTQLKEELEGEMSRRLSEYRDENESVRWRDEFWRRNPSLARYQRVVRGVAAEVAAESDQRGYNGEQAMAEVARRTRDELTAMGITLDDELPSNVRSINSGSKTRIRPAMAESGGTSGRGGTPQLTPVQRQLERLARGI